MLPSTIRRKFFPLLALLGFLSFAPAEADTEAEESSLKPEKNARALRVSAASAGVDENGNQTGPDPDESLSFAAVEGPSVFESEQLIVTGYELKPVEYPALPEVEGTKINSGKKTSFVRPDEFPNIVNNNFNQALATTPGLLVAEEPSSPIVNIGYRGLDTQRSEFSQVLKDGVSIKNEQFGFPETHYTPPLDALDRIEFVRGGAALQFGPQPGGAINYITRMPRTDAAFHFTARDVFGSDELFTSYNAIDGTVGPVGYYAYYDRRQREGFREANSDYNLNEGSGKIVYDPSTDSRIILTIDGYDEEHGEPGGLTTVPVPNAVLYQDDRNASSRFFDRFELKRYYSTLTFEHHFSEETQLSAKAFGGYLSRFSKRQRGGGYGTLPAGSAAETNSIQLREAWTEGAEMRLRHDYALGSGTSTFAGGLYFYHALQDRTDERGATPDADSGQLRNLNTGETWDVALFAENRFQFGRFSITPGVRLENLWQSLDESLNLAKTDAGEPLASRSDFSFVPLFGIGLGCVVLPAQEQIAIAVAPGEKGGSAKETRALSSLVAGPPRAELYANVSQAHRPRTYGELVLTGPSTIVNGDLEEGHSLQYELGIRGKPLPYLTFDLSGFYYTFDDQIGDISLPGGLTSTGNVGDARYAGFEAAFELDLLSLFNEGVESPYGALVLYNNITLLDAEFTSGPNDGLTPAYAPDYQIKTGLLYRWKNLFKAGFLGTMVDDSFATANNAPERFIPHWMTWDLTFEARFFGGRLGVIAGINNLFDEDYWSEARDEGIVPAYGRNYYGGVSIEF